MTAWQAPSDSFPAHTLTHSLRWVADARALALVEFSSQTDGRASIDARSPASAALADKEQGCRPTPRADFAGSHVFLE
jgi:hypothetical protein